MDAQDLGLKEVTVFNLDECTEKDVLDFVSLHLLTQGVHSYLDDGGTFDRCSNICAYRGSNGLKCAVGAIIPSEAYKYNMEESNYPQMLSANPTFKTDHCDLLTELQQVHDNENTDYWDTRLKSIYERLDIPTNILDKIIDNLEKT